MPSKSQTWTRKPGQRWKMKPDSGLVKPKSDEQLLTNIHVAVLALAATVRDAEATGLSVCIMTDRGNLWGSNLKNLKIEGTRRCTVPKPEP